MTPALTPPDRHNDFKRDATEAARSALPDDIKLILLTLSGSHAYGTERAESDVDVRGVYQAATEDTWKLSEPQESIERKEPDVVVHELKKFCRLAAASNPNILEVLYGEPLYRTHAGELLQDNRKLFVSKLAAKTYGGYAIQQLRKAQAGTGGSRGREHFKRQKFVLHLYRLMEQGIKLLETGELNVRVGSPELLWQKADYPLSLVESDFARLDLVMDEACANSPLPDTPDYEAINNLIIELRKDALPYEGVYG